MRITRSDSLFVTISLLCGILGFFFMGMAFEIYRETSHPIKYVHLPNEELYQGSFCDLIREGDTLYIRKRIGSVDDKPVIVVCGQSTNFGRNLAITTPKCDTSHFIISSGVTSFQGRWGDCLRRLINRSIPPIQAYPQVPDTITTPSDSSGFMFKYDSVKLE